MISFTVGVGGLGRHESHWLAGLNICRCFQLGWDETGVYLGQTIDAIPPGEQATLALSDETGVPYVIAADPKGLLTS